MALYLVTFELTGQNEDPELWGILKRSPYWHCMGSTWIVKTGKTAAELFGELAGHLDGEDRLLVVKLEGDVRLTESFPKECREWLERNL